jgi:arylsulfatase A-like enzyme
VAWLTDNGYDYYEPHGARGEMYYIPQVSTLPAVAHPSQWVGNESIRFIEDMAATDQPWCLFSSFIHPHPPFAPPKPWHKLYRAPDMPLPYAPEHSAELHTWVNRLQNRYKYRDRGSDLNLLRTIKAYYYATISFVDFQIGRVLKALEASGELDNTLILFTSDHGEHLGDLNSFGKRSMHDASARVPMILRFPPRFPAGHHCSAAVSLVDVFPTLLAACDIPTGEVELDGIDLAMVGRGTVDSRTVYSQFEEKDKAIYMAVSEHWKYVYSAGDGREFFFDRQRDPHEVKNLAGSTEVQRERETMKQELLRYLANVGVADAYDSIGGNIEWRKHPLVDESYLEDPDAGLLFQDYPIRPGVRRRAPGERYEVEIEGYTGGEV